MHGVSFESRDNGLYALMNFIRHNTLASYSHECTNASQIHESENFLKPTTSSLTLVMLYLWYQIQEKSRPISYHFISRVYVASKHK